MADTPVSTPAWSRDGEKPSTAWMRRHAGWLVFSFPAVLALSLILNGALRDRGSAVQQAQKALKDAFRDIPFKVRLPRERSDAPLIRVFLDKPDSRQGFQAFQLEAWYTTKPIAGKSAETIHVWQTNDKYLARRLKDPLQLVGEEEVINGEQWRRVVDKQVPAHPTTTFSKRYDDGITLTVDCLNADLARRAIASLETANG